ncbi:hypothetical protein [Timonella sp. A28]|uniref:hypothetical protein n=1 Tax=Timonella sp. A28 TaxID=3442640 RepID=UPI003EBA59FE
MNIEWPGVLDPTMLHTSYVSAVDALADAAKGGRWDDVLRLLDSADNLSPNQWRIGGRSWFTPLHQAAWLGAPLQVVEDLVARGAWRSLRNADGDRPIDIARKQGHNHVVEALSVRESGGQAQRKFAAWDQRLAELIAERTQGFEPVKTRPVPTEIIALEQIENLWFGYPGMYGGFNMSMYKDRLFVESWCRVVSGSGQAHVITEGGCVLVEEGFV